MQLFILLILKRFHTIATDVIVHAVFNLVLDQSAAGQLKTIELSNSIIQSRVHKMSDQRM